MLRQIITSSEHFFTIQFPADMVGKTVEVIAFEIDEQSNAKKRGVADKEQKLNTIRQITTNSLVDLSNDKFDRLEANNYEG